MTTFYHDQERQLLVYDEPEPKRIAQYIPEAVALSNGYIAVPESLYAIQVLRWLGHPVPPPMMRYDYPRHRTIKQPFRAQLITANFLAANPRSFCLNEMRTGKTLAALWAADYVMQQYPAGDCKALVVAPLSILQRVWGDAIFNNFFGRRTYVILHGDAKKRTELLNQPADFYIINFDGLKVGSHRTKRRAIELDGFSKALAERSDIRIAIVDEFAAYKHHRTARTRIASAIFNQRDYLWLLSGTPTPNGPLDAFGPAKIMNNAGGESYRSYEARTTYPITQFKRVPVRGAHELALAMLQPAVRFKMTDCVDVPAKLPPQLIDVEMTPEQKKHYKEMRNEAVAAINGGTISAVNEATLRSKLIQIASGAVYQNVPGAERITHNLDCRPRLAACEELVEWAGGKAIILAPLTGVLYLLYNNLKDQYRCAIVKGGQPKQNNEIFKQFVEGDLDVMLADPGTMAHGLDLSVSKIVIWFTLPDKTEHYLQANERIRGPKQKEPTLIAQLAATPVEREIYRRLEANESLQGAMLELVKEETP